MICEAEEVAPSRTPPEDQIRGHDRSPAPSCQQLYGFMTLYDPFRPSRDSGCYRGPSRGHHLSRDKPEAARIRSDRFRPKADVLAGKSGYLAVEFRVQHDTLLRRGLVA
jgi:hypothetical protein